ncbi:MAG TPA: DUF29 family protein [Geminicoccaceae bacterium]
MHPRASWVESVARARNDLEDVITPTLRRHLRERLPQIYDQARRPTMDPLRRHGERAAADALPGTCPYRLADLLRHDWLPSSRHGPGS